MKQDRSHVRRRLAPRAAVALMAVAGSLALATSAGAEPVTGGKTVLKPDPGTFEGLADMSIGVEATGGADAGRNGYSFPITGGEIREGGPGKIQHRGGLLFLTDGPEVKFSKFFVKLGAEKVKVFAKSGGDEVRFFDLDLDDATVGGGNTRLRIKGADALLAKEGAQILSETFASDIRKGVPLGIVNVKAEIG